MTYTHSNAQRHKHLCRALRNSAHFDVTPTGAKLMWHVRYTVCACTMGTYADLHACNTYFMYNNVIHIHVKSTQEHKQTILSYAAISREGKSPKHTEIDGVTRETIIITPPKQQKGEPLFCEMSVGLTAPEERSRDHVCSAIIRQEGFQKGSALITGKHADSTWKRGACASLHPPFFFFFSSPPIFAPPKLLTHYSSSSTPNTHTSRLW